MDATAFVTEYARRFNDGNATGDLSAVASMRTEDANVVWRAPGAPQVSGQAASAGEAIPPGATLHFDAITEEEDGTVTADVTGKGFPPGDITGRARFHFDGDRMRLLEVDLSHPLR